jgi:hypothetical protein
MTQPPESLMLMTVAGVLNDVLIFWNHQSTVATVVYSPKILSLSRHPDQVLERQCSVVFQ